MFAQFFFLLRDVGIPVTPTAFLNLQRALDADLIGSIDDFYVTARALLVKSEKYFDLYDQAFAHFFKGSELPQRDNFNFDDMRNALERWLDDPEALAQMLDLDTASVRSMTPEQLVDYFLQRLREQQEQHQGGNYWIGTRGTSPVGHSGKSKGGMRVDGVSQHKSALKVAMDRRYRDYATGGSLRHEQLGEALKRLRPLTAAGPRDHIDIEQTIVETMRNAGDIEIVFERSLRNKLRVVLAIDNGGWSMAPYVDLVQTLFNHASSEFRDLTTLYFHNTIYDCLWLDAARYRKPVAVRELLRRDADTRIIVVGDASMDPYELLVANASILIEDVQRLPSIERLRRLAKQFKHMVWINPRQQRYWNYTETIQTIAQVVPMFELSVDGIEAAVTYLMQKTV